MMKRILIFLLSLLFALPAQALTQEEMEQAILNELCARHIIGGAVVISINGNTCIQLGYGTTNGTTPVTTDTLFRVASVTKMVSAIGLMHLYDEGYFLLDEDLNDLLPFPVRNPRYENIKITPRQILSHTSGLASNNYYIIDWANLSRDTRYFSSAEAGSAYEYSNTNGGLFGCLIEALTGEGVNDYMTETVFAPLGITAAYDILSLPEDAQISPTYAKDRTVARSLKDYRRDANQYTSGADPESHLALTVGKLFINAEGLNKLLVMLLKDGWTDCVRILEPETVAAMEAEQHLLDGSSVTAESPYGLSLKRAEGMTGGTWYGHQGMIFGFTADAFYQPDTGLCVTVLMNGYAPVQEEGLVTPARSIMTLASEWTLSGSLAPIFNSADFAVTE